MYENLRLNGLIKDNECCDALSELLNVAIRTYGPENVA